MKIEQTFACYRVVGTDYMIYRDVQNGKWGVAEEKDSVYRPKEITKWHDTLIRAELEIERKMRELSRAKRYSAALAQRVKELKEYNGKLRKANREMSDIISWLDNQCEDARQRVKALEGRNDGDEKDESTCTARS